MDAPTNAAIRPRGGRCDDRVAAALDRNAWSSARARATATRSLPIRYRARRSPLPREFGSTGALRSRRFRRSCGRFTTPLAASCGLG